MSDEEKTQETTEIAGWQSTAETLLTRTLNGPVRLALPELLRKPGYRNQIVRFTVANAPGPHPATFIVKIARGTPESPYEAENDELESPSWRFHNEWAGGVFLNSVVQSIPLNARIYGGDKASGLLVMEDLGAPHSLADAMQDTDPLRLRDSLFRYARGLGQLHAATMGREADFVQKREAQFGKPASHQARVKEWNREYVPDFCRAAQGQGVSVSAAWHTEADAVTALLENPGPFLAFSPGDTCPDNHRLMEDGSLRFFDFEFAEFKHALLDAAYLCMPFPTCWCVNRLPETLTTELLHAYRTELIPACPEASDEAVFSKSLAAACALWMAASLTWCIKEALEKDSDWGISTVRQRIPFRLENFARLAEQSQTLPAMAETARALAEKFRALWQSEIKDMPLYPAFRV